MRTAIAEPDHHVGPLELAMQLVEIAPGEIGHRDHHHRLAVALEEQVIGEFVGADPHPLGDLRDAVLGIGLVIGIVAERVHLVELARHVHQRQQRHARLLGQYLLADLGLAQFGDLLGERQCRQLLVGRPLEEGIGRNVEAEHHADRARIELRLHVDALFLVRLLKPGHHLIEPVRPEVRLRHGEGDGNLALLGEPVEHVEIPAGLIVLGVLGDPRDDLEDTAMAADFFGDRQDLGLGGIVAGDRHAIDTTVEGDV